MPFAVMPIRMPNRLPPGPELLAGPQPGQQYFAVPDGAALTYSATQTGGSVLPSYIAFTQSKAADPELMLSGTASAAQGSISVALTASTMAGHSVADTFAVLDRSMTPS